MTLPTVQKKWIIQGGQKGLDELRFIEGPIPKVDGYGVLVKLHAAGLNPRDYQIPQPGVSVILILFSILSHPTFFYHWMYFTNNMTTRRLSLSASNFLLLVDQMALVRLSQWGLRSQSGSQVTELQHCLTRDIKLAL